MKISENATIRDPFSGKRRPLTRRDLDDVFYRAARQPNGRYRVLVSRFAPGRPLGNFRYYGTRPDDPNDIVPHEHRRELRGARVFGAWLNHDDSRGVNSLDMLETRDGRGYIQHYMFDFGSILGSGTVFAQRHRAGNEYIYEPKPGWLTLATLGLVHPAVDADRLSRRAAVDRTLRRRRVRSGGVEARVSRIRRSTTCGPTTHSGRRGLWRGSAMRPIRAIVEKAQYTDPRATDYMTADADQAARQGAARPG